VIAYGEYSWVYWDRSKKGALLRKSLKQWLSELPRDQFIRVHRRAIVNLAWMERVEKLPDGRMQIRLRDVPEPIVVSQRLAPILNRRLKARRGWGVSDVSFSSILGKPATVLIVKGVHAAFNSSVCVP